MNLSSNQIQKLLDQIKIEHTVFIGQTLGRSILSDEDIRILRLNNINPVEWKEFGRIDEMYKLGILAQALKANQLRSSSFIDLSNFINSDKFRALTPFERVILDQIKAQGYKDIKGLGNKVADDFNQILIEVDRDQRKAYEKLIQSQYEQSKYLNESIQKLTSRLGHATKDWARDFQRIAAYLMHDAFDHGKALALYGSKGNDVKVYKHVLEGACNHCVELYLTAGLGSEPKIFTLNELMNNGSNIGRKTKDWKPVIGPTHPYCRCEIMKLPEGSKWKDNKFIVSKIKKRKFPKPVITIEEFGTEIDSL